jgi:hypothetical protein
VKLTFRIECPHCNWGVEFRDSYVNQGWLRLHCNHCDKEFFNKITVTGVKVETQKELPECMRK